MPDLLDTSNLMHYRPYFTGDPVSQWDKLSPETKAQWEDYRTYKGGDPTEPVAVMTLRPFFGDLYGVDDETVVDRLEAYNSDMAVKLGLEPNVSYGEVYKALSKSINEDPRMLRFDNAIKAAYETPKESAFGRNKQSKTGKGGDRSTSSIFGITPPGKSGNQSELSGGLGDTLISPEEDPVAKWAGTNPVPEPPDWEKVKTTPWFHGADKDERLTALLRQRAWLTQHMMQQPGAKEDVVEEELNAWYKDQVWNALDAKIPVGYHVPLSVLKGAITSFGGAMRGPAEIAAAAVFGGTDDDTEDTAAIAAAGAIGFAAMLSGTQDKIASLLPEDPVLREAFLTGKLPSGVGSALGFAAGGALTGGSGMLKFATLGASAQATSAIEQARAMGREDKALEAAIFTAPLGALEGLGFKGFGGQTAWRIAKGTAAGQMVKSVLAKGLKEGGEEGLQELLQGLGNTLYFHYSGISGGELDLDMKGLLEDGAVGFLTGAGLGGVNAAFNQNDPVLKNVQDVLQGALAENTSKLPEELRPLVKAKGEALETVEEDTSPQVLSMKQKILDSGFAKTKEAEVQAAAYAQSLDSAVRAVAAKHGKTLDEVYSGIGFGTDGQTGDLMQPVTPELSSSWRAAVDAGDMAGAQAAVDEAAKAAFSESRTRENEWEGDLSRPLIKLYHGGEGGRTSFAGTQGRTDSGYKQGNLNSQGVWLTESRGKEGEISEFFSSSDAATYAANYDNGEVYSVYANITNPKRMGQLDAADTTAQELLDAGYDGAYMIDTGFWVALDPNQIKFADPVTYDDQGAVIPLEERFNTASNDIRYQPNTMAVDRAVAFREALNLDDAEARSTMLANLPSQVTLQEVTDPDMPDEPMYRVLLGSPSEVTGQTDNDALLIGEFEEKPTLAQVQEMITDGIAEGLLTQKDVAGITMVEAGGELQQGNKGYIKFLEDGKVLLRALEGADASTFIHELGHFVRRYALSDEHVETIGDYYGVEDGDWAADYKMWKSRGDVASSAEERFAKDFERYFYDGILPANADSALKKAFKVLKELMREVYKALKGSPIAHSIDPDVRAAIDSVFEGKGKAEVVEAVKGKAAAVETQTEPQPVIKRDYKVPKNAVGADTIHAWEERRFLARMQGDKRLADEVREISSPYRPISNVETLAEIKDLVDKNSVVEAAAEIMDYKNGMEPRMRVAAAERVILKINEELKAAKKAGDLEVVQALDDLSAELAIDIASFGTEMGQGIQMFAVWSRLTPEGALNALERRVKKKNPEFQGYSEDTRKKILDLQREAHDAPTDSWIARDKSRQILALSMREEGITLVDVATAFWYANILSSINTQTINLAGNGMNLLMRSLGVMTRNNPKLTLHFFKGMAEGAKRGMGDAKRVMGGEWVGKPGQKLKHVDVLEFLSTDSNLKSVLLPSKAAGATEKWVLRKVALGRYIARLLNAGDMFFYRTAEQARIQMLAANNAYKDAAPHDVLNHIANALGSSELQRKQLMRQAREDVDGMSDSALGKLTKEEAVNRRLVELTDESRNPDLVAEASLWAKRTTFTNDPEGFMGSVAWVFDWSVEHIGAFNTPWGRVKPLTALMPFRNIVANVGNALLDNTIVGVIRSKTKSGHLTGTVEAPLTEMERRELYAQGVIGMAMTGAIVMRALSYADDDDPWFMVYGLGPSSKEKRSAMRSQGWSPYSIKIGDTFWNYNETPLAIPLAIYGGLMDVRRYGNLDDKNFWQRAGIISGLSISAFADSGFLSSIVDLGKILGGDREGVAVGMATRFATGFIPVQGLFNDIARLTDPEIVDKDTLWSMMVANIPLAQRFGTEPMLNGLGDEVSYDLLSRTPIARRFASLRTPDPEWKFLATHGLGFSAPGSGANRGGVTYASPTKEMEAKIARIQERRDLVKGLFAEKKLTDYENRLFIKRQGPLVREAIKKIAAQSGDKDQETLQEELDTAVAKIRKQVKIQMLNEMDASPTGVLTPPN